MLVYWSVPLGRGDTLVPGQCATNHFCTRRPSESWVLQAFKETLDVTVLEFLISPEPNLKIW